MSSTSPQWAEGLSFITDPKGVEHDVEGKTMKFLPVTGFTLLKLRGLAEPIGKALAVLFDDKKNDVGSIQREWKGGGGDNEAGNEIICEAATKDVIELRIKSRAEAVRELAATILDPNSLNAFGEIILDSLRNHKWKGGAPPVEEFIKLTPLPALFAMLVGVAKANKGVFGPLGSRVGGMTAKITAALEARLDENLSTPSKPSKPSKTNEIASAAGEAQTPEEEILGEIS